MADTYWLSFRLHEDSGYESTYNKLQEAIKDSVNGKWWFETTSFFTFASNYSMNDLASKIKSSIRPDRDLVLIGMTDYKSARLIGKSNDRDIDQLIPFLKRV